MNIQTSYEIPERMQQHHRLALMRAIAKQGLIDQGCEILSDGPAFMVRQPQNLKPSKYADIFLELRKLEPQAAAALRERQTPNGFRRIALTWIQRDTQYLEEQNLLKSLTEWLTQHKLPIGFLEIALELLGEILKYPKENPAYLAAKLNDVARRPDGIDWDSAPKPPILEEWLSRGETQSEYEQAAFSAIKEYTKQKKAWLKTNGLKLWPALHNLNRDCYLAAWHLIERLPYAEIADRWVTTFEMESDELLEDDTVRVAIRTLFNMLEIKIPKTKDQALTSDT